MNNTKTLATQSYVKWLFLTTVTLPRGSLAQTTNLSCYNGTSKNFVFLCRIRTTRMRSPYSNVQAGFFEKGLVKEFSRYICWTLATRKVDYMEEECSNCHKKKVRHIATKFIYIVFTEIKRFFRCFLNVEWNIWCYYLSTSVFDWLSKVFSSNAKQF